MHPLRLEIPNFDATDEQRATAMRTWLSAAMWPWSLAQSVTQSVTQSVWLSHANQNDQPIAPRRPAYQTSSGFAVAAIIHV